MYRLKMIRVGNRENLDKHFERTVDESPDMVPTLSLLFHNAVGRSLCLIVGMLQNNQPLTDLRGRTRRHWSLYLSIGCVVSSAPRASSVSKEKSLPICVIACSFVLRVSVSSPLLMK